MYKYETHAHTSEASICGHVPAVEVLHMYKKAGYQGIVFTDHFNEENLSIYGPVSWEEKIDRYLSGFKAAVSESGSLDMDLMWGIELRFTENDNDFLVYGIDENFLKERENIHESTFNEFMKSVSVLTNILVFQAHPYRDGCFPVDPLIVHGFEVFNGNPRHDSRNDRALAEAAENNLLVLSGSDFHRPGDLATGGVAFNERARSMDEFTAMVRTLDAEFLIRKDVI